MHFSECFLARNKLAAALAGVCLFVGEGARARSIVAGACACAGAYISRSREYTSFLTDRPLLALHVHSESQQRHNQPRGYLEECKTLPSSSRHRAILT